ncbi:TonB-dependent receptor plug domain-containing protein [Acinetobacter guerrae]|uniref:TonB-dependent receptor plug domain-containing protein n=1 Tax=Acinetobacter guerrae TaxID=1843371 RepID=UPI00128C3159|nr:TonB-dependent receptor [Acinetobacter guerrae]MPW43423.1 ligand-gated channel protein [Acinetobacter guerrae]
MSISLQPTRLVAAIAVAMGFSSVAFADESTNATKLDPIVVTASKSAEKVSEVPARISIIEPQILEQSPIAELPHLLMSEAAINMVQSGGYGQVSSIFLRGTNSNHTLVLRDGVRLNTATTGAASLAFIDTTDLKQIEVLKGPASVLYGTDAIGGVVQLISKTPEKNSAFVTGEYGEHNTYKSILGADVAENGFYAQVRGQRLETDGTQVTDFKNTDVKSAGYDQKGFSTKIGVEKENYAFSADYNQNQGTSGYIDCATYDASYNCTGLKNLSQDFKNEIINLKGRLNLNEAFSLNARLSQFKDDIDQNNPNYDDSYDFIHSKTQEAELYGKWQFAPHQNVLFGATHQTIKGDILSFATPYDGDVDSTGYYIQHQYSQPGLNTQVGLRVEDNQKYGTHTVGQAAIRYQPLPLTSVYANIGTAFRSPTLNELYSAYGNPDLKPEESISYEIGLDQKLNYGLSTGLSLYKTKVDDLIDYDGANGYKFGNVSEASFEGGEAYISWQHDIFFSKLGYNYVKATNEVTDKELNRRPRQSLTFTAGLRDENYGVSGSLSSKSSAKDYQQDTPGYVTLDLNAYWNINQNIKVFTNIENVGDVNYKTASYGGGYYYINGGRLASAGVTLSY